MVEIALALAIVSLILSIGLMIKGKYKDDICSCPICQHIQTLSDEAIEDIIKGAIPEIKP